ncbi:unnamed protein product [Allacma fusca]|uniref:EGF domain-specific O-linked N-acetylglucosamine transferase n=1 Tax=Allacma fusca TaxID=39272 RepID=A0A8J2J3K0_9HEXA|nr:unnamed protein product [Allacma fusca]
MKIYTAILFCATHLISRSGLGKSSEIIDLPEDQIPFYFSNYPDEAQDCLESPSCAYKYLNAVPGIVHAGRDVCWGYEEGCHLEPKSYSHPKCDDDHKGWVKSKEEQIETFYKQGDFGFVKNVRNSFSLLCEPTFQEDSSLECSDSMTFCRARNIMIDFTDLEKRTKPVMYDTDVLKAGQIGGHCKLLKDNFKKAVGPMGSLQSWTPEIQNFVELNTRPLEPNSGLCDQVVTRPTIIMKIDATVSYYHHFCDFVNLYMSLHVNSTSNMKNPFSKDVNIMIWRTYEYQSNFGVAFRAFTNHRLLSLNDFSGKKVCFKNAVFPLLPRMIFGLYYNTPLIWGCRNSGLFHAFSKFMLHRLKIKARPVPTLSKLNVTFISRQTRYRKVLNEDILLQELRKNQDLNVIKADFTWSTPFAKQLEVIQNTDILIGMHGAGLTHLLFLPDWAAVFELYNCEDEHCYADLARLRGVKYITWEKPDKLEEKGADPSMNGSHAKHTNYIFDVKEFVRLVRRGIKHVKAEVNKLRGGAGHDEL